jgi:hypothetical protein
VTALWANVRPDNRCGTCHEAGGQAPMFAREDDVNLAYDAANTIVNLADPNSSQMVLKVSGGHHCWLGSDAASLQACGDIVTTWIENWANASGTAGARQIDLAAPALKDGGASRRFPADPSIFAATVYPVTAYDVPRRQRP